MLLEVCTGAELPLQSAEHRLSGAQGLRASGAWAIEASLQNHVAIARLALFAFSITTSSLCSVLVQFLPLLHDDFHYHHLLSSPGSGSWKSEINISLTGFLDWLGNMSVQRDISVVALQLRGWRSRVEPCPASGCF